MRGGTWPDKAKRLSPKGISYVIIPNHLKKPKEKTFFILQVIYYSSGIILMSWDKQFGQG